MRLLVGSLVRLLVGKSYRQNRKMVIRSLPTNDLTNNRINWISMNKKLGLGNDPPTVTGFPEIAKIKIFWPQFKIE